MANYCKTIGCPNAVAGQAFFCSGCVGRRQAWRWRGNEPVEPTSYHERRRADTPTPRPTADIIAEMGAKLKSMANDMEALVKVLDAHD